MNVIQRKAYAEAFGMSVQDMSTMLRKQEFEAKLGDAAAKSAKEKLEYADKNHIQLDEALRQQYEQKSLADDQKEVFEKLKEVLVKITSGPMKVLFHQFENILGFVGKIGNLFGALGGSGIGSKLGAALLLLPVLAMAAKTFTGLTPATATWVRPIGAGMGMGGGMGGVGGGMVMSKSGQMYSVNSPQGKMIASRGGTVPIGGEAGGTGGFMSKVGGRMGAGIGLGAAGMGLNMAAGAMDEGTGKEVVSGLGSMASMAGMGMMVGGPVGAGIGALVGLTTSIFSSMEKSEERAKAEAAAKAEADNKTREMMENLSLRPMTLSVNNETIGKWNTLSDQNGANSLYS